jgi:5-methylcytosine-specific restriction endonuclease McrA
MQYPNNLPKLVCELVPAKTQYINLRKELSALEWDYVRKNCYRNAGYVCEICDDNGKNQGRNHPVECHEKWEIDHEKRIQTLTGVIALCPECHQVKHAGLAHINGRMPHVLAHLVKVNQWTLIEAMEHVNEAFQQWNSTQNIQYVVDMSYAYLYLLPQNQTSLS